MAHARRTDQLTAPGDIRLPVDERGGDRGDHARAEPSDGSRAEPGQRRLFAVDPVF